MSARFEITRQHPGASGVHDILRRQIEAALAELAVQQPDNHRIHQLRKHIKAARGTLRLLRPAVAERAYRAENHALRDAARLLSAARDGPVLVKALTRLQAKIEDPAARRGVAAFGAWLRERAARERRASLQHGFPQARTILRTALKRLRSWRAPGRGWKPVREGLHRTYRKARREAKRNARSPSSESLHEWRKTSKYLRNQLQLIAPAQHASLARLSGALHDLGDALGDHHDLVVLDEMAANSGRMDESACTALRRVIARRMRKLQRRALRAGCALFREKPAHLDRRLRRYFGCWPD
jgi:CHAD domain-containing protein